MDLPAALGRLIMPAIRCEDETFWPLAEEMARAPGAGGIGAGGFLVFGGDREWLPGRLAAVRKAAGGRPLLFAADLERGAGQQVAGLTRLPHLMAIGATGSEDLARRAGKLTAREARAAGLHLALAPCVDLNTDPKNPIINVRAFGDDPQAAGKLARAWVAGCRAGGALSCAKHYPGHGHTSVDSHIGLPRLGASLGELEMRELAPFRALAGGDPPVDAVMTAHIAVPALTEEGDLPATLSPRAIAHLREKLGFAGLVVTDALLMGAITASFDEAEAGVRAIEAGCDILLYPADPKRLLEALVSAVEGGRLSEDRVRASLERLDRAIEASGAAGEARVPASDGEAGASGSGAAAPDPDGGKLADEIARGALARIFGEPLARPAEVVAIVSGDPSTSLRAGEGEAGGDLAAELQRREPKTRVLPVSTDSPPERLATVAESFGGAARSGKRTAVALFSRVSAWKGGSGLPEREAALVADLVQQAPLAAVVACGGPWLLESARGAGFGACAFSDEAASQRAVAAALLAQAGWPGKAPVDLKGLKAG